VHLPQNHPRSHRVTIVPMVHRKAQRGALGISGIVVVAALLGACAGMLPPSSAKSTSPSSPAADANSFAQQVLAEAVIPPGAHSSSTFDSDLLKQPFESITTTGLIDLYRLYVVDEPPSAVESFIAAHLPKGATVSGTGTLGNPQGSADGFEVSMPTSGPNQNYAELVYALVADGVQACEFRVDAQVIWVPDRSADDLLPAYDSVEVTGFSQTSLANESSGPVSIELSRTQADALRTVINSLPLAPPPACMEDSLLYKIAFRPSTVATHSFELDGYECVETVLVFEDGKALPPLSDASCSLLHAVVSLLPDGQAGGTRSAAAGCAR
jgi:hypothetical protein